MKVKKNARKSVPALKPAIIKKIKGNNQLIGLIIIETRKSYPTVKRWLDDNSAQLTMAACLISSAKNST